MPEGLKMDSKPRHAKVLPRLALSAALGLFATFAAAGVAAAAERYQVVNVMADKSSAVFLDMGSFRRSGDTVEASSVVVFGQPRTLGADEGIVFFSARNSYSCSNRTRTTIEIISRGADLTVIGREAGTARDRPVVPDSIESIMLDRLCGPNPTANIDSLPSDMQSLRRVLQ